MRGRWWWWDTHGYWFVLGGIFWFVRSLPVSFCLPFGIELHCVCLSHTFLSFPTSAGTLIHLTSQSSSSFSMWFVHPLCLLEQIFSRKIQRHYQPQQLWLPFSSSCYCSNDRKCWNVSLNIFWVDLVSTKYFFFFSLQVRTTSAQELDASSQAPMPQTVDEEMLKKRKRPIGRWKHRWAAASVASTLQADDPFLTSSGHAEAAVFRCWPRFLWSGEAELCCAIAVAHAVELEDLPIGK